MTKMQAEINEWLKIALQILVGIVLSLVSVIQIYNYTQLGDLAQQAKDLNDKIDAIHREVVVTKTKAERNEREIELLRKEIR